jgi:hypothetical protein
VINGCLLPGVEIPNLLSFITDKNKIAETLGIVVISSSFVTNIVRICEEYAIFYNP